MRVRVAKFAPIALTLLAAALAMIQKNPLNGM
jgi:hypothetical protein